MSEVQFLDFWSKTILNHQQLPAKFLKLELANLAIQPHQIWSSNSITYKFKNIYANFILGFNLPSSEIAFEIYHHEFENFFTETQRINNQEKSV